MTTTNTISTGKRKHAIARVMLKAGSGQILVNGRKAEEYFPRLSLQILIREPFASPLLAVLLPLPNPGIPGEQSALPKYDPEILVAGG